MDVLVARCAGLDMHKDTVMAAVRTPVEGGERREEVREFRTFTDDLVALRDWLRCEGGHAGGHGSDRRVMETGMASTTPHKPWPASPQVEAAAERHARWLEGHPAEVAWEAELTERLARHDPALALTTPTDADPASTTVAPSASPFSRDSATVAHPPPPGRGIDGPDLGW